MSDTVVVTGANGLVGSQVCRELAARGHLVRGLVRRPGTAPTGDRIHEVVGHFDEPTDAARVLDDAAVVVTTVAAMKEDEPTQRRVSVDGTMVMARAAREIGLDRFVHVSTTSVYDRRPSVGDIDEDSALVGDHASAYAVTKRDADLAVAECDGITRVVVRPPCVLGNGETSTWNQLVPESMASNPAARTANPVQTYAWVHVTDLAAAIALAVGGEVPGLDDGGCHVVNVAAPGVTWRDYLATVAEVMAVDPNWTDEPVWTGQILTDRVRGWGWQPQVTFDAAMRELRSAWRAGRA